MCEANAYLKQENEEVLFMEAIDIIEPFEEGLKLVDIFGRQKFIKARIKEMTLLSHRIILEPITENLQSQTDNFFIHPKYNQNMKTEEFILEDEEV